MPCNKLEITKNRTVVKWTLSNNSLSTYPSIKSKTFQLKCLDCEFYLILSDTTYDSIKLSLVRKKIFSLHECIDIMQVTFVHNEYSNMEPKVLTMKSTDIYVQEDLAYDSYNYEGDVIFFCYVDSIGHDDLSSKSSTMSNRNLGDDLQILLDQALHSDIKLVSNGKEFMAHKAILSARSPVFQSMFNHDTKERKENSVVLDDMSVDTVSQLLKFIYTGAVDELSADDYLSLFVAADKYAITNLKHLCSRSLCSLLTPEMCLKVLAISHMHQDDNLRNVAMHSMQKKPGEIIGSPEWLQFMKEYPEIARNATLYIVNEASTSEFESS